MIRSTKPLPPPPPSSPQSYFPNDDDFNWNFGIAKAATGKYREAEEALSSIQNEKYRCG